MGRRIILWLAVAILVGGVVDCVMAFDEPLFGMERFANMKRIGMVTPRRAEDIEASRWGVQFNKHDLPPGQIDMFLERIAESGVKWTRVETRKYPIAHDDVKEQGYYRWSEFDSIIDGLSKRKIEMFVCINAEPFEGLDSDDGPLDPESLKGWLEYVRAVVERYRDRVQYWEIHNEPKANANYAKVVKAASKTIKKIDPQAKIVAGSIARVNVERLRLLLEDCGIGPFIDIITYHPYNEFPEASKHLFLAPVVGGYMPASAPVAEMFELLGREDRSIALWQGECGYPSSEYTTGWKGRGPWGDNIQAKWLLRRFLTDFSMDIPVNIYFLLREPPEDGRVNAKGLLRYGTWEPKPGYRALQHITSVFDQRLTEPKTVEAVFEFEDEGSFYGAAGENLNRDDTPYSSAKSPYPIQVVGLTGSGGDAVVYYTPWRMQEYVKPAKVNIRIKNVSIQDPVVVDLLTGQVYQAETSTQGNELTIKGVSLTDYPMAVVNRKCVTMK